MTVGLALEPRYHVMHNHNPYCIHGGLALPALEPRLRVDACDVGCCAAMLCTMQWGVLVVGMGLRVPIGRYPCPQQEP